MNVLLISPTALDNHGQPIKQRRLHLPALTLPLLAAATPPDVAVTLVHETVEDVPYDRDWDLVDDNGATVPSGIYFYRLAVGDESVTQKIMVLRK